ncbi:YrhB domain-containing protein [Chitinophaga sp. HK235]|uniref:YrhB domain-containing protein n=1 Tax=Chitinophaga sp. HK235 TaxID=2952571 RepID=UPI001BA76E2A|nr:YrhB domain-containing protein [Chitinophaga sp. HK235]
MMILNLIEAKDKAYLYLKDTPVLVSREELVIMDEYTIEFEYGWAFFYQTKKFVETGDIFDGIGGGALIVNKFDGSVFEIGSARSAEEYIDEYVEECRKKIH